MHTRSLLPFTLLLLLTGTASAAPIDCKYASQEAEKAICRDEVLKALDARLDSTYRRAVVSAVKIDGPQKAVEYMLAWQQSGIEERIACGEKIDVKACISDSYTHAITELEAKYLLVQPVKSRRYLCPDDTSFLLSPFKDTMLPAVAIDYKGSREVFMKAATIVKDRYDGAAGGYILLNGSGAIFVWDSDAPELRCTRE